MKIVVVDKDESNIRNLTDFTKDTEHVDIIGSFTDPFDAYEFLCVNRADVVFLDVEMSGITGLQLGKRLRKSQPSTLIIMTSQDSSYLGEANEIGVDYFILKPFKREVINQVIEKMKKINSSIIQNESNIFIRTSGSFMVMKDKKPIPLVGKAKEIMALIVYKNGTMISNKEIYQTLWPNRPVDNEHMKVYFNALNRMRKTLKLSDAQDLLVATPRGQMLNTEACQCDFWDDYYLYNQNKNIHSGHFFDEFTWAESVHTNIAI